MTYRTEFRTGSSVTTTVEKRTFRVNSSSTMRGKTLSPGARDRMEHFYDQVDDDLDADDGELDVWDTVRDRKAKRKYRKAMRRLELSREIADYWRSVAARANFNQRHDDDESAPFQGGSGVSRPHSRNLRKFRKSHKRREVAR